MNGLTPWNAKIDEFLKIEPDEEERKKIFNYCKQHVELLFEMKAANSLEEYHQVIFNALIAILFSSLGVFIKMHTTVEE